MRYLFEPEVIQNILLPRKPYLLLGKGQSYSKVQKTNLLKYQTIGLNHIAEKTPVDLTHCIDLDVLSDEIVQNSKYVIIPYHPHINFRPSKKGLSELLEEELSWLPIEKILWYHCSTYKLSPNRKQCIQVRCF
jgi:hypothetical protein